MKYHSTHEMNIPRLKHCIDTEKIWKKLKVNYKFGVPFDHVRFFFLSNPQSIKYCSASAEYIFVQYHYRLRGLPLCILALTKDTGVSAAWYGAQSHNHSLDLGCPSSIPVYGGVPCSALCHTSPQSVEAFPFRLHTLCSRWKLFTGVECHWWNWREIWQPFLPCEVVYR